MNAISVVIIAKNESEHISGCIRSARLLTNDVIVVDAYSEDDTVVKAKRAGARIIQHTWNGYGQARNVGAAVAENDWIFNLDADERFTDELVNALSAVNLNDLNGLWLCRRIPFLSEKPIRHGSWGHDRVLRFYNRRVTSWNNALVHEGIEDRGLKAVTLQGSLLHYTAKNAKDLYAKAKAYAFLSAQKKSNTLLVVALIKFIFSPCWCFIQNYFFRLGFLDRWAGVIIAVSDFKTEYYKYLYLIKLKLTISQSDNS